MHRIARTVVLALAATLALAGCATSSPDSGTTPAAVQPSDASTPTAAASQAGEDPASGTTIDGTGYSFVVPEGWEIPAEAPPAGIDVIVADLTDTDGFSDNINVVLSPAGEVTPEQVESEGVDELEGAGATDITARERVTVAGSESAHLSAGLSAEGATYQIEQFYLTHEGQTYVVTFSFSPTVTEADRDALAFSVLDTWTWA